MIYNGWFRVDTIWHKIELKYDVTFVTMCEKEEVIPPFSWLSIPNELIKCKKCDRLWILKELGE